MDIVEEKTTDNLESELDAIYSGYDRYHYGNRDLAHDFKLYLRLVRRSIKTYLRDRSSKRFTNVVYVTTDCPDYMPDSTRLDSPIDFVAEMRNQYPNTNIQILLPLIGLPDETKANGRITVDYGKSSHILKKMPLHFDFFVKNQTYEAHLYKYEDNSANVSIYAIYSPAFSYLSSVNKMNHFENIVPFLKAARETIKQLGKKGYIDIVHSDKIPFLLGAEFEKKFPASIKIFQTVDDFARQDALKQEPFWTLINIADKKNIKKICRDSEIKRLIIELFNINLANFDVKIPDLLDIIYKNYTNFKWYSKSAQKEKGEQIFEDLNSRIIKLYSNIFDKGAPYYYPILNTIKNSNFWAVLSKTYYNDMFKDLKMPEHILKQVKKLQTNSTYVQTAFNFSKYINEKDQLIYNDYSSDNFRDKRNENKESLLKEFSSDRLKTDFIDRRLFKENAERNVVGYLDNFYKSPLMFAHFRGDVFEEGIDIFFATIFKLFEINRNIQIILCIPNGLKSGYIKSRIEFIKDNPIFKGRFAYIDSEINLTRFFAGSDIFLLPARVNYATMEHLLGMHFGCVPVVSNTGWLNDTVIDMFTDLAKFNGFKAETSMWKDDCVDVYYSTLSKALEVYKNNPGSWNVITRNCMNYDFNYSFKILEKYNSIYQEIL